MSSLEELFCHGDDWCQRFEPEWEKQLRSSGGAKRKLEQGLCLSEMMTMVMPFHQNHYRNFKHFFLNQIKQQWGIAFLGLPRYQRFMEWMPSTLIPLWVSLKRNK